MRISLIKVILHEYVSKKQIVLISVYARIGLLLCYYKEQQQCSPLTFDPTATR